MTYEIYADEEFPAMLMREQDWWYANRDKNPFAFDDEMTILMHRLPHSPWSGISIEGYEEIYRSLLLRKTHHRVAYKIDDEKKSVTLLAVWGLRQLSMPKLH